VAIGVGTSLALIALLLIIYKACCSSAKVLPSDKGMQSKMVAPGSRPTTAQPPAAEPEADVVRPVDAKETAPDVLIVQPSREAVSP
jgi:hypothetical protein